MLRCCTGPGWLYGGAGCAGHGCFCRLLLLLLLLLQGSTQQQLSQLIHRLPAATYPAPFYVVQIVGDDGEELTAVDVVKQPGGISGGVDGPRATFSANVQFSITDPAYGAVSGSNEYCSHSVMSAAAALSPAAAVCAQLLVGMFPPCQNTGRRRDTVVCQAAESCLLQPLPPPAFT